MGVKVKAVKDAYNRAFQKDGLNKKADASHQEFICKPLVSNARCNDPQNWNHPRLPWYIECCEVLFGIARAALGCGELWRDIPLIMKKSRLVTNFLMVTGVSLAQSPQALAGWTGQMNGSGVGRGAVNVTSATGTARSAITPIMVAPSAAMRPTATYAVGAELPPGATSTTSALLRGSAGYIWQASTFASGGDKTDNPLIESLFEIIPQHAAFLSMNTSVGPDPNGPGMMLNISGFATGGTALLVRGYEWLGEEPPTEEQLGELDPLIWQPVIGEGLFDPSGGSRSSFYQLSIPFPTLTEEEQDNFYLITDGFATSAVPDGGSLTLALALSAAGMAAVRRTNRRPVA